MSRIDAKVDPLLAAGSPLRGRAALANAQLAYHDVFLPAFTSERWLRLADAGANLQRPLWASTGVKDPAYPPTLYVDRLVGAGTVTTVPDVTLDAFRETGIVAPTLHADVTSARATLDELAVNGIDLRTITRELEDEGVERFAAAYTQMLEAIDALRTAS